MTRRQFMLGGAAFATLGAFAGNRFMLAAAGFNARGKPRIRFGVLSDIHIMSIGKDGDTMTSGMNNLTFKRALEWFREQGVDAVVIAGDMADKGMDDQLMAVSEAWYSVFPGDKYPDGRPIEKVFVTGNHDWQGWYYALPVRSLGQLYMERRQRSGSSRSRSHSCASHSSRGRMRREEERMCKNESMVAYLHERMV